MILNLLIPNLIFINILKILLKDQIQLLLSELSGRFWSQGSNQEFRLDLIPTRTFSIPVFFGSHVYQSGVQKRPRLFSFYVYAPCRLFFNFIKLLKIISHRNKHYASRLQLFQQRLRDIRSCACYSYPVIRGILRTTH